MTSPHKGRGALGSGSNYAGPPAPEDADGYRPAGGGYSTREGRISRGSRLSKEAFEVIRHDRGLLSLALAALVLDLVIVGAFLGLAAAIAESDHRRLYLLGALAAASYPISVVGTFVNVALLNTVTRRWNGESATIRDGLAVARRRWRPILAWSLVTATIGTALSLAERINHFGFIERLVAFVFDIAWGAAAFFVIPALAADGVGPREAFKRSVRTVRHRWAEGATGTIAIGGASGLLVLPGVLLCGAGYQVFGAHPGTGLVLIAIGILAAAPVLVYANATAAVFTLAVYRYSQDIPAAGPFAESDLANPFVGGMKHSLRIRGWFGRARRSSDR